MKLKELLKTLNSFSPHALELEVLVRVGDAVLLPIVPNVNEDDNLYSITYVCVAIDGIIGKKK